jgi:hypothetical protein
MPLAQLVDALPALNWRLVSAVGLLSPVVGLALSTAIYGFNSRRAWWTAAFYALSLPLAGVVMLTQTENPLAVCSFLLLLPIGVLLSLFLLVPLSRHSTKPGICRRCGYDLRATPGRCPECGTAPAVSDK